MPEGCGLQMIFDCVIIGAGVVGCACARELRRYGLRICVLEKELDVCCETSGRNSGVLHAGFNNRPGSKMARFCVEGNAGFDALARELDVPYRRTGKLVVGFDSADRERLEALMDQGRRNHVPDLAIIGKDEMRGIAPQVRGEFAMWSGSTAVLDPFLFTVALAESAAKNGVEFRFGWAVDGISLEEGAYTVRGAGRSVRARWVINCAGLGADRVAQMVGIQDYTIHPCRGEYFVLDKRVGELLPVPAYPVPNPKAGGLGVHLTPSVDGTVFVGPSDEYIDSREDYAVTRPVLDALIRDGSRIFPHLKREYFIRNYAGIRPKLAGAGEGGYRDFVIERRDEIAPRFVNLVGIESPGLTSAAPIAREVARLISEVEPLTLWAGFDPQRKGIVRFRDKSKSEQAELVRTDPDYGEIICRCELVTRAEVLAAIRNPLGVDTVAGIKYRCRAMMGRCQGGYCQTRIAELIMQEKKKKCEDVRYLRRDGYLFTGTLRGE